MTSITDFQAVILLSICIAIFILYKSNVINNINIFEKKTITLVGYEETNRSNNYSNKIIALNNYLMNEKKITNLIYTSDTNIVIGNMKNYKLDDGIYLDVTRTATGTASVVQIAYNIWTYGNKTEQFLKDIYRKYKNNYTSEIILIGDETNDEIDYPVPIHAINYYLFNIQFPKLKCMKQMTKHDISFFTKLKQTINAKNDDNTDTNKANEIQAEKYIYTLGNIENYNVENIHFTIYREQSKVYYLLKSDSDNCKEWIEKQIQIYNQKKDDTFKNKVVIQAREITCYSSSEHKIYYYPNEIWALNYFIIEIQKHQKHRITCGNSTKYNGILEEMNLYEIEPDLYLTVYRSDGSKNTHLLESTADVIYTLYSNENNIKDELDKYVKLFNEHRLKQTSNKILYHFIYNGLQNNVLNFTKKILSEKGTERECFETFGKIHNEHTERIKNDISRLKDLEYHKKHGKKRKLGYLFYGKAGCAKTSTVVAMALHDERHIIEIPFSNLTKQNELEQLLNLDEINGVKITNEQAVISFDEIDFGMEKFDSPIVTTEKSATVECIQTISAIETALKDPTNKTTIEQKITMGTLLSKFDGISNLNGLIIVGTTNNKNITHSPLCRKGRMTPIEFKELRKEDAIKIIESRFEKITNATHLEMVKDRKAIPVDLIAFCEVHEKLPIDEFFEKVKESEIFEKEIVP